MRLGTTGGITEPSSSRGSGITRNQAGCGVPGGGSPAKGVVPSAIIPPVTVKITHPGPSLHSAPGRISPAHNHCVNRDIDWRGRRRVCAWTAGGERRSGRGRVRQNKDGAAPPRGSVVASSSMAESSGETALSVGAATTASVGAATAFAAALSSLALEL
jgi:hypothetical protein